MEQPLPVQSSLMRETTPSLPIRQNERVMNGETNIKEGIMVHEMTISKNQGGARETPS